MCHILIEFKNWSHCVYNLGSFIRFASLFYSHEKNCCEIIKAIVDHLKKEKTFMTRSWSALRLSKQQWEKQTNSYQSVRTWNVCVWAVSEPYFCFYNNIFRKSPTLTCSWSPLNAKWYTTCALTGIILATLRDHNQRASASWLLTSSLIFYGTNGESAKIHLASYGLRLTPMLQPNGPQSSL